MYNEETINIIYCKQFNLNNYILNAYIAYVLFYTYIIYLGKITTLNTCVVCHVLFKCLYIHDLLT